MENKIKIKTGTVQETLLLPLWGRAYETRKKNPRLVDNKAIEIMEKLDYDFSEIKKTQALSQHGWVARSLHTDKMVLKFINNFPNATIVNIGCGMDTTFSRIDNGKIMYYELDLPEVINLRKNFYNDTDRHKSISSSFLDTKYFEQIEVIEALLFLAGGVLYYFSEEKIKKFFIQIADYFKQSHLYFDSLSPKGINIARKLVLKKGGMGMSMDESWGLKPIKSIEKWDKRFKVLNTKLMYKDTKTNIPFLHKIILTIPDMLGFAHMVHLKIDNII